MLQAAQIAESHGITLLFSPPYNAQFNPIEHCWYKIKHLIYSTRGASRYSTEDMKAFIMNCYSKLEGSMAQKCRNSYQHVIKVCIIHVTKTYYITSYNTIINCTFVLTVK